MVLVQHVIGHPAFEPALNATGQEGKGTVHGEQHYPKSYLENARPLPHDFRMFIDLLAFLAVEVVSWASYLWAISHTFNLYESHSIGTAAFIKSPKETIWCRQVIVLAALGSTHATAAAVAYHVRDLLFSPMHVDAMPMVEIMLAEARSQRTHMATFIEALNPKLPLRITTLAAQALTFPLFFLAALVYPPLLHAYARLFTTMAMEFHTGAMQMWENEEMPTLRGVAIPPATRRFYGLDDKATWRDMFMCIRADNLCHAQVSELCERTNRFDRARRLAVLLGKGAGRPTAPYKEQQ